MITLAALQSVCQTDQGKKACESVIDALNRCMAEYAINTPVRVSAFIAQVMHESAEFTHFVENLNYGTNGLIATWPSRFRGAEGIRKAELLNRKPEAIANYVYADRMGNGNEASGDGWAFRGRGAIQLTGREMYRLCGKALLVDLEAHPYMLEEPEYAIESACWFWSSLKGLNAIADKGSIAAVTKIINGGEHGLVDRMARWKKCQVAFAGVTA